MSIIGILYGIGFAISAVVAAFFGGRHIQRRTDKAVQKADKLEADAKVRERMDNVKDLGNDPDAARERMRKRDPNLK